MFANTLAETRSARQALALVHGMGEPLVPAARRVGQMREGVNYEYVPGYDIFKDNRIANAGLSAQMHLFYGWMSPNQTKWIIGPSRTRPAPPTTSSAWAPAGRAPSGPTWCSSAPACWAAPLTYTPVTLGVKGVGLANKALRGALGGSEIACSPRPAAWCWARSATASSSPA